MLNQAQNAVPIRDQRWPEGTAPLVSICCTTFNHEKYIRECLDGFLMQKTTFPVEILVHDDASTDSTASIIREYARTYRGLINPIYQSENQYSQGRKPNMDFNLPRVSGDIIAFCEGDDFWTDPDKLRIQVDAMTADRSLSSCCTNFSVVDEDGVIIERHGWGLWKKAKRISHLMVLERYIPKTMTLVVRKAALPSAWPDAYRRVPNGDNFFSALVSLHGDIGFIDRVTGCYRDHSQGIWSGKTRLARYEMQYITFKEMERVFRSHAEILAIQKRIYVISQAVLVESVKELNLVSFSRGILNILRIGRSPWRPLIKALRDIF